MGQTERGMTFQVLDQNATLFQLTLVDQDFDAPGYDGSLVFSGTASTPEGTPYAITIVTNLRLLTNGTRVLNSTIASPPQAIGFAPDMSWVAVTRTEPAPGGSLSITQIETSEMETRLAVEGDYPDLEAATGGMYDAGSLELALAQSLASLMARPGGGPVGGGAMNLASCKVAAEDVCGDGCVKSVTLTITYNAEGNVASTSCSFECKDDCP